MSEMPTVEPSGVQSLDSVLNQFALPVETRVALTAALVHREDQMADFLRMSGQRFGLFPQIVAEVLAETGLGTTPSPEARDMIHRQFHQLMDQIARAFRGEGPMPTP